MPKTTPDRFFILSGINIKRFFKPDRMKNLSG